MLGLGRAAIAADPGQSRQGADGAAAVIGDAVGLAPQDGVVAPGDEAASRTHVGAKELEYTIWFGTAAPAKTPAPIVKQITEWFAAARQAPEVTEKLAIQGLFPERQCGAEFTAMMRKEYDTYGRVIREAGIKAE